MVQLMKLTRRSMLKYSGSALAAMKISPLAFAKEPLKKIQLIAQFNTENWFENTSTKTWTLSPDPIELKQFEETEIIFANHLNEPASVHWHGLAVDNAMDGVSGLTQSPVQPGQKFTYKLTPNNAGTYWAHAHHQTYRQLAMGLYIPLIVREKTPYFVDRDLLFVADDWLINKDGQIDTESFENGHTWSHGGRMGNFLTINRQRTPLIQVSPGERIRLRMMNVANSRVMTFNLPGVISHIIAKDGQPIANPIPIENSLTISPAERFDLIVDIPNDWQGEYPIHERSGSDPFTAANWLVAGVNSSSLTTEPVKPLPPNTMPTKFGTPDHTVTLNMEGGAMGNLEAANYQGEKLSVKQLIEHKQYWTFNGQANLPDQPLARVKVGDVVEIELKNTTRWPHAMHLHGHHFRAHNSQVGAEIWQDTLLLQPRQNEVIRFVASSPGRWLLHCHMIEHQVSGMVTYLEVIE